MATTLAVAIAFTCLELSAPNWADVNASNWAVPSARICAVVNAAASELAIAATAAVVRLLMAVSDAISADPIATTSAVSMTAT